MSIKSVRYLSVLLLALLITTVCLACKGTEASVSAEQVLENMMAAQADVESFQLDATISVDVQSPEADATISADADCALDLKDKEMEAVASMAMNIPGMTMNVAMQAYAVDDYIYVMTSMFGQEQWTKQAIPAGTWQNIENSQYQIDSLLEVVEAEVVKEESLNGVDCYVLALTPDLAELQQALLEQPGIGDQLAEMPDLESMVQKMTFKIWVAKDTYFLMKAIVDMTVVMDAQAMGMPAGEGSATIELSLQMAAHDYNEPVSVDLPAEAATATEGDSGFDLPFF
ncbi:MAG: hypothetical protein FJ020_07885 [Chloroflexi bacterium]|nr:hypothetical protein [Chloroflexota bacterium]